MEGPAIPRNPVVTTSGEAVTTPIGLQQRPERGASSTKRTPQQSPRAEYGTHADRQLI